MNDLKTETLSNTNGKPKSLVALAHFIMKT